MTILKKTLIVVILLVLVQLHLFAQPSIRDQAPKDIAPVNTPFGPMQIVRPVFPNHDFDIRTYGAVPGGIDKNTDAIRKTINAASSAGGGRVVVPAGVWLTGPVHLENNINLYLVKDAELRFSQDVEDYLPAVFSRHEDTECYKYSAFVYANGKTNIAITGEGTLNGQGKPWWSWKETRKSSESFVIEMGNKNIPVAERVFDGKGEYALRPAFFQPMNSKNVLVEGVTFLYGAFWTVTPTYCENVIVRKVKIVTIGDYGHTPNGDGVDPSSCKNVLIEYCEFDAGDDCIAIKSGRDNDGLRVGKPTENVVIRHCVGLQGHGGIVIGSETSGSVRNVYAHDNRFNGTDRIVRIKTARGRGGIIENMWFERLSAETIEREAIHLNMLYTGSRFPAQPVQRTTPAIRNIHFADIACGSGKTFAIELLGLPESVIENISFEGIAMNSALGIHCVDAKTVTFKNMKIIPSRGPVFEGTDCQDIMIDSMQVPVQVNPFMRLDGSKTGRIVIARTNVTSKNIEMGPGVTSESVEIRK